MEEPHGAAPLQPGKTSCRAVSSPPAERGPPEKKQRLEACGVGRFSFSTSPETCSGGNSQILKGFYLDKNLGKTALHACILSRFSQVPLLVTPWTVAHQPPLSMRFPRQEYWRGLPCPLPEGLPHPGIEPTSARSICNGKWVLYQLVPPGKPKTSKCPKSSKCRKSPSLSTLTGIVKCCLM